MSDLYNELIDELEKCNIFVRYSTIEPKTILDFSKHDKPFKVKIRELEESYQKNTREIWALEKEMDIILNTLDLELQNNKVSVLKENEKVVELDFSEHDKAFEDKIAELKKDYKTASELLGKYQRENESLKKRIQELDTIDTIRIDENRELKQRIAELESKETEKPTKYITVIVAKEINGQEYVRLDDFMSVVNDLQAEIGT